MTWHISILFSREDDISQPLLKILEKRKNQNHESQKPKVNSKIVPFQFQALKQW